MDEDVRIAAQRDASLAIAKARPRTLQQLRASRRNVGVNQEIGQTGQPDVPIEAARVAEQRLAKRRQRRQELRL